MLSRFFQVTIIIIDVLVESCEEITSDVCSSRPVDKVKKNKIHVYISTHKNYTGNNNL